MSEINQIVGEYDKVRRQTVKIANLFEEKDWLKQSMADASPIRWHLGHTSWFFDHFVLKNHVKNYQSPGKKYDFFESICFSQKIFREQQLNTARSQAVYGSERHKVRLELMLLSCVVCCFQ